MGLLRLSDCSNHCARAEPPASAPSRPQHPFKHPARGARARTKCAAQDGAKQVGLPGTLGGATYHLASRRRAEPRTTSPTLGVHTLSGLRAPWERFLPGRLAYRVVW